MMCGYEQVLPKTEEMKVISLVLLLSIGLESFLVQGFFVICFKLLNKCCLNGQCGGHI